MQPDFSLKFPQISSASSAAKYALPLSVETEVKTFAPMAHAQQASEHVASAVGSLQQYLPSVSRSTSSSTPRLKPQLCRSLAPIASPSLQPLGQAHSTATASASQPSQVPNAAQFRLSFLAQFADLGDEAARFALIKNYIQSTQSSNSITLPALEKLSTEELCAVVRQLRAEWGSAKESTARAQVLQLLLLSRFIKSAPTLEEYTALLNGYIELLPFENIQLVRIEARILWMALEQGLDAQAETYEAEDVALLFPLLLDIPGVAASDILYGKSGRGRETLVHIIQNLANSKKLGKIALNTTLSLLAQIFLGPEATQADHEVCAREIFPFILTSYLSPEAPFSKFEEISLEKLLPLLKRLYAASDLPGQKLFGCVLLPHLLHHYSPMPLECLHALTALLLDKQGQASFLFSGALYVKVAEAFGKTLATHGAEMSEEAAFQYFRMLTHTHAREIDVSRFVNGAFIASQSEVTCLIHALQPLLRAPQRLLSADFIAFFMEWFANLVTKMQIGNQAKITYLSANPLEALFFAEALYTVCAHLSLEQKERIREVIANLLSALINEPNLLKKKSVILYQRLLGLMMQYPISLEERRAFQKAVLPTLHFQEIWEGPIQGFTDFLICCYLNNQEWTAPSPWQLIVAVERAYQQISKKEVSDHDIHDFFVWLAPLLENPQRGVLDKINGQLYYELDNFQAILLCLLQKKRALHLLFEDKTLVYLVRLAAITELQRKPFVIEWVKGWDKLTAELIQYYRARGSKHAQTVADLQLIAEALKSEIQKKSVTASVKLPTLLSKK